MSAVRVIDIDGAASALGSALRYHAGQYERHAEYGIAAGRVPGYDERQAGMDEHESAIVRLGRALTELVGPEEAIETIEAAKRAAIREVHGA